jgi:hypothetical protein
MERAVAETKAKRRARIVASFRPVVIRDALGDLKKARDKLRSCGCKNAADYVARALKSAEGAANHAERMAANG